MKPRLRLTPRGRTLLDWMLVILFLAIFWGCAFALFQWLLPPLWWTQ